MCRRQLFCFALFLSTVASAQAHRDFERAVGQFIRDDEVQLRIVAHSTDGIVVRDPVSYRFRQDDGREVARTPFANEIILRWSSPQTLQLFQFGGLTAPFPERVQIFDGYTLRDDEALTSCLRGVSVYFLRHWKSHAVLAVVLSFAMVLPIFRSRLGSRGMRLLLQVGEWCAGLTVLVLVLLVSQGYFSVWLTLAISVIVMCLKHRLENRG